MGDCRMCFFHCLLPFGSRACSQIGSSSPPLICLDALEFQRGQAVRPAPSQEVQQAPLAAPVEASMAVHHASSLESCEPSDPPASALKSATNPEFVKKLSKDDCFLLKAPVRGARVLVKSLSKNLSGIIVFQVLTHF